MNAPTTVGYFMEDPREADRLEQKVNPEAWVKKYLERYLRPDFEVLCVGCGPGNILRAISASQPTIRARVPTAWSAPKSLTDLGTSTGRRRRSRHRSRRRP